MDLLFELIAEIILEGSMEIASNRKISKWIRYPILGLLVLFFAVLIFGIILLGIILLDDNILAGIFMIALGIFFLVASIIKSKKTYFDVKNDKSTNDVEKNK